MNWKGAAKGLARDLNRAAHGSAVFFLSAAWFGHNWETVVLAAGAWVALRGLGFVLEAWAGP
ncbi:MAG: hypothetical protein M0003_09995 [Acidithiobacillus sp.]|jgi:hypothetical protein|uniref:hypothetical protein n=1 Tax=Acidithiobacillus ferrooxidans TaxID=920 RepID=UPI000A45E4E4|nr:hypothetical protein [Acidithiobacillus ferrooxidans]MDA8153026.1 hypothetical protein [Acidithiobacillus sp.]